MIKSTTALFLLINFVSNIFDGASSVRDIDCYISVRELLHYVFMCMGCVTYRLISDRVIGFFDTLYIHTTRDCRQYSAITISILYSSPLHILVSSVYYTLH
jgi:hypothetical protein